MPVVSKRPETLVIEDAEGDRLIVDNYRAGDAVFSFVRGKDGHGGTVYLSVEDVAEVASRLGPLAQQDRERRALADVVRGLDLRGRVEDMAAQLYAAGVRVESE